MTNELRKVVNMPLWLNDLWTCTYPLVAITTTIEPGILSFQAIEETWRGDLQSRLLGGERGGERNEELMGCRPTPDHRCPNSVQIAAENNFEVAQSIRFTGAVVRMRRYSI